MRVNYSGIFVKTSLFHTSTTIKPFKNVSAGFHYDGPVQVANLVNKKLIYCKFAPIKLFMCCFVMFCVLLPTENLKRNATKRCNQNELLTSDITTYTLLFMLSAA